MANRLVIDTDPGVDDATAIVMAAAHPEGQTVVITTVAGNHIGNGLRDALDSRLRE